MSLFQAYSAVGGFFVALGALLIFFGERIAPALEALPRSRAAETPKCGNAEAFINCKERSKSVSLFGNAEFS